MNWDRVQGYWQQVTGKAREQWGKLIDNDLDIVAGRRDQLMGKIRERNGVAKDDTQRRATARQHKASDA